MKATAASCPPETTEENKEIQEVTEGLADVKGISLDDAVVVLLSELDCIFPEEEQRKVLTGFSGGKDIFALFLIGFCKTLVQLIIAHSDTRLKVPPIGSYLAPLAVKKNVWFIKSSSIFFSILLKGPPL